MPQIVKPTPEVLAQFHRDGFLVLPDILSADEIATVRAGLERAFSKFSEDAEIHHMQEIWRPKLFEQGPEFDFMLDHPGVAELMAALLGDNYHAIALTGLRTLPGKTISFWHLDDACRFPIPDGLKLDPAIPMPVFTINMNYYVCDVDEEMGPTHLIPGSHRAGRPPTEADNDANGNPRYEGRTYQSSAGKAGTLVLWNDQVWHRGGPNLSNGKTRWVLQTPFARRWVAQRFYPFVNYKMPQEVVDRLTPTRKRILGFHGIGPYG